MNVVVYPEPEAGRGVGTKAGRQLLDRIAPHSLVGAPDLARRAAIGRRHGFIESIAAIEAEAVAAYKAELAAKVRALPMRTTLDPAINRREALALIEGDSAITESELRALHGDR